MISIIIAAAVVGVVGVLAGILLGVASEKFKVKEDEVYVKVREVLPGNNCGGCGYPGCAGMAEALVNKESEVTSCKPSKPEAKEAIKQYLQQNAA